jgi:hypothetical protein
MFVLVLNQNNLVQDGKNNNFIYKFPNSVNLTDKYIAVSSVSMYYSWANIGPIFNNNVITFTWTAGAVTTQYAIQIPEGLYEISTINSFIQWFCIQNGLFWTEGGNNYYPFELIVNPSRYAVQLNTYLIPTVLPAGATVPGNFPGWPTVTQNSVVSFPSFFNKIIGFPDLFASNPNLNNLFVPPVSDYVSKNANGTISYLSTTSPNIQPNSTIFLSISNINNPYSQPSSIIYALSPSVGVGEQIVERPPNFMWNKLIDGTYNQLRLTLLGTDLSPIKILDPNITIILAIRDKSESMIGSK